MFMKIPRFAPFFRWDTVLLWHEFWTDVRWSWMDVRLGSLKIKVFYLTSKTVINQRFWCDSKRILKSMIFWKQILLGRVRPMFKWWHSYCFTGLPKLNRIRPLLRYDYRHFTDVRMNHDCHSQNDLYVAQVHGPPQAKFFGNLEWQKRVFLLKMRCFNSKKDGNFPKFSAFGRWFSN